MSIKIENLTHTYMPGSPFASVAIHDVNLEIADGELIGLLGHTGSGKTTLIQHLNGLVKATEGRIVIDGLDLTEKGVSLLEVRKKVGLVFQYPEYQLFEETVAKDIAFGPKNMGLPADEIDRRVRYAMQQVGLDYETIAERSPFELSGGQMRRVAIAGVLAMQPKVLILDEPTAGLDPAGRNEILGYIDHYRRTHNATVMMVSHSMDDVARLTDRLLVMNGAHLAMDGTPAEVFQRAEELLEMGLNIPQVTRVFLELKKMGAPVDPVYTIEQAVEAIKKLKGGKC